MTENNSMNNEKIKMMFSLLGELVVMFLSLINIFKKKDDKTEKQYITSR